MIEALRIIGNVSLAAFLGINVLLHFLVYPLCLMCAQLEREYITDDERRTLREFDKFGVNVWIPGFIVTLGLSLLVGVGVLLLTYLRQLY